MSAERHQGDRFGSKPDRGERSTPRVLICEDSTAYARALAKFLEHDGDLEVVAICPSGEDALRELNVRAPDLVTMDLEMPGMGGVRATEEIMRARPTPILIVSAHAGKGSERAAEALAAGALEVLAKDGLRLDRADDVWARAVRSRVRRLASVRLGGRRDPAPSDAERDPVPAPTRAARVIGVGASAGGPPALVTVFSRIPVAFQVPIVVVQHIATGFIEGLIHWLDQQIEAPVRIASESGRVEPGVWFAPDGAHLLIDPSMRFALDDTTPARHRPSADVLLESIAHSAGEAGVGVILTGMGDDGRAGVEAIIATGGLAIAQDEASSAVYGMPHAAARAGAASMPIEDIGAALGQLRVVRDRA